MTDVGALTHLLRNTPIRELVAALRKDRFSLERETRTGGRIYSHDDGRIVVIHYHPRSSPLTRKMLRNVLQGTRWTENDLRQLNLIKQYCLSADRQAAQFAIWNLQLPLRRPPSIRQPQ